MATNNPKSSGPFRPYSSDRDPIRDADMKVNTFDTRFATEATAWASELPRKHASGLLTLSVKLLQWASPLYPWCNRAKRSPMTAGTTPMVDPRPIARRTINRAIWGGPFISVNCTRKDRRRLTMKRPWDSRRARRDSNRSSSPAGRLRNTSGSSSPSRSRQKDERLRLPEGSSALLSVLFKGSCGGISMCFWS